MGQEALLPVAGCACALMSVRKPPAGLKPAGGWESLAVAGFYACLTEMPRENRRFHHPQLGCFTPASPTQHAAVPLGHLRVEAGHPYLHSTNGPSHYMDHHY